MNVWYVFKKEAFWNFINIITRHDRHNPLVILMFIKKFII